MPMSNWIETQDIHLSTLKMQSLRCVGFNRAGVLALRQLVKLVRANNRRYMKEVGSSVLTDKLAEELKDRWLDRGRFDRPDVKIVDKRLTDWLDSFADRRTHFIPCSILPERASSFVIGGVRFVHLDEFDPTCHGLKTMADDPHPLKFWMDQHGFDWIAIVQVENYETSRAKEVAEIAVDLSLAVFQVLLRDPLGRNIARATGRTVLPIKPSLIADEQGHWTFGRKSTEGLLGATRKVFEEMLETASGDIERMGRVINDVHLGKAALPKLHQSWCDALFWFHEGVSEPLDTIAIAKLETAIENLFAAESSKKSKARLLQGFNHLLGMGKSDLFDTTIPVSVGEFVDAVVTTRSRILHGTWSTLAGDDIEIERRDVARLAQNFLLLFSRALGAYSKSGATPPDNIDQFLAWLGPGKS